MRHLAQGLIYSIGAVAPLITTLLITPFVTRLLGDVEYGTVALTYTVGQASAMILSAGMPAAITRHIIIEKNGEAEARSLVLSGLLMSLATATAAGIIVLLISSLTSDIKAALIAGIISGASLATVQEAQAFYRGTDSPWTFILIGALASVVPNGAGLIFIEIFNTSATAFIFTLSILQIIIAVIISFAVQGGDPSLASKEALKLTLRVGLPTIPHQASVALLLSTAVFLSQSYFGAAVAGEVQLAALLGTGSIVIVQALNNAWAPLVYRTPKDSRHLFLKHSTAIVAVAGCALTVTFSFVAEYAVQIVGGPVASDRMLNFSLIISSATAFMIAYLANIHHTFISGRTWPLAITSPTALITTSAFLAVSLELTDDVRFIPWAWALFYLLQFVFSTTLALRGNGRTTSLRLALLPLSLCLAFPLITAATIPPLYMRLGLGAVASALVVLVLIVVRRKSARTHNE